MAYDEKLADRIRRALGPMTTSRSARCSAASRFLRSGRMFVGITGDDLMVRVGPERYEESLGKPHVRPMDFTGRPMKGYVYVAPAGRRTDTSLRAWVTLGARFVATLPQGKSGEDLGEALVRDSAPIFAEALDAEVEVVVHDREVEVAQLPDVLDRFGQR